MCCSGGKADGSTGGVSGARHEHTRFASASGARWPPGQAASQRTVHPCAARHVAASRQGASARRAPRQAGHVRDPKRRQACSAQHAQHSMHSVARTCKALSPCCSRRACAAAGATGLRLGPVLAREGVRGAYLWQLADRTFRPGKQACGRAGRYAAHVGRQEGRTGGQAGRQRRTGGSRAVPQTIAARPTGRLTGSTAGAPPPARGTPPLHGSAPPAAPGGGHKTELWRLPRTPAPTV